MTFKLVLLTSALALTPLMAADHHQQPVLAQEETATNQTVRLAFGGGYIEVSIQQNCLYRPNNQLTGPIPTEIGNLTNLQVLYLYDNHLTGEIPAAIRYLTNLTELYLSDNHLTGEIPAAIGELKNLQILSLHNNQLTGGIPEEVWGLPDLKCLNVHGNAVFGREIIFGREINVNTFFSLETVGDQDKICMVNISNEWPGFDSHFTDGGLWQEELIRGAASFTALALPLQALLIAELANYGYAQEMVFTFPNNGGVLTIGSGAFGQRVITVSERAAGALSAIKTELEKRHMPLGEFRTLAENGEHPVGLVYLEAGKQTKSANKL